MKNDRFYKVNKSDKIWWVKDTQIGVWEFSFDKTRIYNMFRDYPKAMSKKEVEIFNKENPYWADFFAERRVK